VNTQRNGLDPEFKARVALEAPKGIKILQQVAMKQKSRVCLACLLVWGLCGSLQAATVNATFNNAWSSVINTSSYTATGNTINFSLNFTPSSGTSLTVIRNTGLGFIQGTFDNLAQGQMVVLGYGGQNYYFIANYYGHQGSDLVLAWANSNPMAWGAGTNGQLGNSSTTNWSVPVAVNAAGALWGKYPVTGSAGGSHSLALAADGTVAAWGLNSSGQLGNSSTTQSTVPVAVTTSSGALVGKTVVAVSGGGSHSLALCSDGTVAAWGLNGNGQLGNNSTTNSSVPVAVPITGVPATRIVIAVSAGGSHSMALCSDGTIVAWGSNTNGQLGNNSTTQSTTPVAVTTSSGALSTRTVIAISAGANHSLAVCSDGTAAAWGLNTTGQLGNNSTTQSTIPVTVINSFGALTGKTVMGVSAGGSHSLAVCTDGTAAAWGLNTSGQLGNNSTTQCNVPVAVTSSSGPLNGKTVVSVSAGANHSMADCADGTMATWGMNTSGQLGNNSTSNSLVPMAPSRPGLPSGTIIGMVSGSCANHVLSLVASPETEISGFGIQKQRTYNQTSAAAPAPDPEMPYMFTSYVQAGTMASLLSSSTLTPPVGSTGAATYQRGSNGLQLQQNFPTKASLDAAYTAGNFFLMLQTSTPNTYNGQLTLGADNYPAIPQITSVTNATWSGGSLVVTNIATDVTITWSNPAATSCYFQVNNTGIYSNNSTTGFTIPGNSLQNNSVYKASIQLANYGAGSTIPGLAGNGFPSYQTQVQVNILTGTATASKSPSMYLLLKNHLLVQTSNSAPVDCLTTLPYSDPAPYSLTAQCAANGSVTGPATLPLGYRVDGDNSNYRYQSSALTSLSALNSAYPDGTYTFPGSMAVSLAGDTYPAGTQILTVNGGTPVWDARGELALDPTVDNTITWSPVTIANFATSGHEGVFFESFNDYNFNNIDLEFGVLGKDSPNPISTLTIPKFSMTPTYTYIGDVNYVSASTVGNPATNVYQIAGFQTETQFQAVALKPQTLTFGTIAAKQYPGAAFAPGATASSGLAVSYTVVSGPATVSGNSVTLTGVGIVTLKASQPGTGVFASAADVTQSFTVSDASLLADFRWMNGLASDGSQDLLLPAGDGVPHLLKYAFNMIGAGTGQAAALTTPNQQTLGVSGTAGLPRQGVSGGKLVLTYIRRKASSTPGITYEVEFSNSLAPGSWTVNGSATETTTSIDANFERVTVTDSAITTVRFARVRVSET